MAKCNIDGETTLAVFGHHHLPANGVSA